jgi:uncharacterized NAD-dependent epimerase/dehydratase family protein
MHTNSKQESGYMPAASAQTAARPGKEYTPGQRTHRRKARCILTVSAGWDPETGETAYTLFREFRKRNLKAEFVPMPLNGGKDHIPSFLIDPVVSIGAAAGQADELGCDYIIIEGYGSLSHWKTSGIALRILHSLAPDAIILCCQSGRDPAMAGHAGPDIGRLVEIHESVAGLVRPVKVVGLAVNPHDLTPAQSCAEEKRLEMATGLPAIDVTRFGAGKLVRALLAHFGMPEA